MARPRSVTPLALLAVLAACSSSGDDAAPSADVDRAATRESTPGTTGPPTITPATSTPQTATPATTAPGTTAPETTAPPSTDVATTVAPETTVAETIDWEPTDEGAYEVGVATITLDDPVRPLTVDVWFPLDAGIDVSALAPQQYTLLPGVYYESPDAFAATAEQIDTADTFPLIVYSHGSGGLRYIHSSYAEGLASHGYVVAAPDHAGNTVLDQLANAQDSPAEIGFNRSGDVRRVIDAMVDQADPAAGGYAARVDPEQVAVTGHSVGGSTTIASVTGFSNELGDIAPDGRVDAIVPIAPALGGTSDDQLAAIDVPMMIVVGTDDITTPVDPNVIRLWDLTTDSPAYRVELVAGEHQTFTDICAYQDAVSTLPDIPEIVTSTIDEYAVEGCSPGDIDSARAVDLTNTYVLDFLAQVFDDGPPIDPTVVATPADVIFDAR